MAVKNGYLTYTDGTTWRHDIYVMGVEQSHSLSGSTQQGRLSKQFYPRAHAPGDMIIKGQCTSQEEYQELALFIRKHHHAMMAQPANETFNRGNSNQNGYKRLMQFVLNSEGILVRGFIPKVTIVKRGVHDPAPQFSLSFTVIYDAHSMSSMRISQELVKYYDPYDADIRTPDISTTPSQNNTNDTEQQSDGTSLPISSNPFDPFRLFR